MENWKDRKDFSFSHLCLIGGVEEWRNVKLICLINMKKLEDKKYDLSKFTFTEAIG